MAWFESREKVCLFQTVQQKFSMLSYSVENGDSSSSLIQFDHPNTSVNFKLEKKRTERYRTLAPSKKKKTQNKQQKEQKCSISLLLQCDALSSARKWRTPKENVVTQFYKGEKEQMLQSRKGVSSPVPVQCWRQAECPSRSPVLVLSGPFQGI